eukprot:m.245023 g.245023  ORF g.245023 m.245023 type:complete len:328 (+) comp14585_c0_seq1:47-1030(+)
MKRHVARSSRDCELRTISVQMTMRSRRGRKDAPDRRRVRRVVDERGLDALAVANVPLPLPQAHLGVCQRRQHGDVIHVVLGNARDDNRAVGGLVQAVARGVEVELDQVLLNLAVVQLAGAEELDEAEPLGALHVDLEDRHMVMLERRPDIGDALQLPRLGVGVLEIVGARPAEGGRPRRVRTGRAQAEQVERAQLGVVRRLQVHAGVEAVDLTALGLMGGVEREVVADAEGVHNALARTLRRHANIPAAVARAALADPVWAQQRGGRQRNGRVPGARCAALAGRGHKPGQQHEGRRAAEDVLARERVDGVEHEGAASFEPWIQAFPV